LYIFGMDKQKQPQQQNGWLLIEHSPISDSGRESVFVLFPLQHSTQSTDIDTYIQENNLTNQTNTNQTNTITLNSDIPSSTFAVHQQQKNVYVCQTPIFISTILSPSFISFKNISLSSDLTFISSSEDVKKPYPILGEASLLLQEGFKGNKDKNNEEKNNNNNNNNNNKGKETGYIHMTPISSSDEETALVRIDSEFLKKINQTDMINMTFHFLMFLVLLGISVFAIPMGYKWLFYDVIHSQNHSVTNVSEKLLLVNAFVFAMVFAISHSLIAIGFQKGNGTWLSYGIYLAIALLFSTVAIIQTQFTTFQTTEFNWNLLLLSSLSHIGDVSDFIMKFAGWLVLLLFIALLVFYVGKGFNPLLWSTITFSILLGAFMGTFLMFKTQ